ncbi:phage baseplate protein [Enterobacter hormaechei]|uniref:phage baseplate protein n=1 Tax=Enterobacter hormaechei TaxID=158836 RepID=UPI001F4A3418|nr:hypothetical protein [Enterobacter hormaechei]
MADITLKYLTDLPAAASAALTDLLHVNQSGNDRSLTVSTLLKAIVDGVYPIGSAHFFTNTTNPNVIWPGTTWARIPGAGRTIRLANNSGSDTLQIGGSDSITITASNLAPHTHPIDVNSDSFDYGSKTTSTYSHSHTVGLKSVGTLTGGAQDRSSDDIISSQSTTTSSDNHAHSISIGAHYHRISGDTGSTGSATPIDTTNQYIKLAGWYRTA